MENINYSGNISGGLGSLQVGAFLNSIATPAQGATVRITDPYNNAIIDELQTNSLGQIPTITLPTPPLEYSMDSEFPRPFNEYNVSVTFPDFEANINNVQVFPTSTAIQNVILNPLFEDINIPYPVLWGDYPPKIPESEIKKLPFPSNLVVLPKPVVPALITVHAGVPDDTTAPNYTIGFKDYIKNVASCEIYSTWPKEALKANILVILSFAMNRIYTEWYRGKGYDFNITNSTAFDQAFVYGRNIFKENSDIVDELFTTYITRPDIKQPLFTQYSDGARIVRSGWLSQWGSKNLADQGYTALQILKSYYGYNIVLREAEKVEGIPFSFPGYVLQLGSRGEPVRIIQNQLNAISDNFPAIPKLIEDGVYGESTAEAVRAFQEIFNLPVDGRVNFPTWYKISDIYVAVTGLSKQS